MSILRRIRLAYFCYFSKPQSDRPLYRAIWRRRARKIVELGIGNGRRALRMLDVAKLASPGDKVDYWGFDPFEDRSEADGPGLTLKAAHQLLRRNGVRVRLLPGDPADSLVRAANSLGKIDLLILPAALEVPAFARMWFFVPRMLDERSLVFVERKSEEGGTPLALKPRSEIDALASLATRRQAA